MNTNLFVIGIDDYTGCRKLNNCVRDVENIVDVLTDKYQFEKSLATTLTNNTATQINVISQLEVLLANQNPAENLVILFSGHGDYDDKLDMGYLLPADSALDNKASYIPNSTLFTYIKAYEYRHVVLLFDSCFSGSFFPATKGISTPKEKLFDIPSKWALTSGRMELVSDGIPGSNSPFATSLIDNLKTNTDDLFGISELAGKVVMDVTGKHSQIPRGEPLQNLGHKGGEFMFKLKAKKILSTPQNKQQIVAEDNELFNVIKAYFDVLLQIEDADNDNKIATANRLVDEANVISKIIRSEITKHFEFVKSKETKVKLFPRILGGDFEKTMVELRETREQKNDVVKRQRFDEAAALRDKEKGIQEQIFNQIVGKEIEFRKLIKSSEDGIVDDYCILSDLTDFTPFYGKSKAREYVDDNFVTMYFNKLAKDLGFVSTYKFKDIFVQFQNEIIPICLRKIFKPEKEQIEQSEQNDYTAAFFKPKPEPKIAGLEAHQPRVRSSTTGSSRKTGLWIRKDS